jgi:hypothetical protein
LLRSTVRSFIGLPVSYSCFLTLHDYRRFHLEFWKESKRRGFVSSLIFFEDHRQGLEEAIFWLVHEARHNSPGARTILMGHSFGAMVLANAIAQAIASSVAGTPYEGTGTPNTGSAYCPADLVLLINSAGDSMRAKGLEEMLSRMGSSAAQFVSRDRPLVISVTSTGDDATGNFFPLGTSISNALRGFRRYDTLNTRRLSTLVSQRYFVTHTPGHNSYLLSHEVKVDPTMIVPSKALQLPNTQNGFDPAFARAFDNNLSKPLSVVGDGGERRWRFQSIGKNGICWSEIVPIRGADNVSPYWIVRVPPSLIRDHSDIFNQQSLCLYSALFRIDTPAKSSGPVSAMAPAPGASPIPEAGRAMEFEKGPRLMRLPAELPTESHQVPH